MKTLKTLLLLLATLLAYGEAAACTSALVSATRSSEGVPMLWKHRDSKKWDCKITHVEGGKYAYTALTSLDLRHTYSGINSVGFAVLNTVASNMSSDKSLTNGPGAVALMGQILAECATVDEFEEFLRKSNGKRPYVTNYAAGDPSGALAYFEVWSTGYKRYDVSEREQGFDVRSNFAYCGDMENPGSSVGRYNITMRHMSQKKQYSPSDFIAYSRNFELNDGSNALAGPETFVCHDRTVPRYFSAGATIAICDKENPRMLVVVGHPVTGMAVPVYVNAKHNIPECVGGRASLDLSNEFRTKAYKEVEELKYEVNEPLVEALLKIEAKVQIPSKMPANIKRYNAAIDKSFAKHAAKIRKVMSQF